MGKKKEWMSVHLEKSLPYDYLYLSTQEQQKAVDLNSKCDGYESIWPLTKHLIYF